jgi:signal transduction histidine kinase
MEKEPYVQQERRLNPVPTGVFVVFVGGVCLALAASGFYSVATLARLEATYLENRARETATALDLQARGPGRRNNPDVWQNLLENALAASNDSVAFLALIDGAGSTLAGTGGLAQHAGELRPGFNSAGGVRIFVHDFQLAGARQGMAGAQSQVASWRLRVGLYAEEARFIRSQVWIQLIVTFVAIVALLLLSGYLLRALRHYVEFQRRENSELHLRALGTMAATLAHEIRNPLGAIKGLTQLAQEDLPADHQAQGMMQTVIAEAQRLERLVTDLLVFARQPKLQPVMFEVSELLATVQTLVEDRLHSGGVGMEIQVADGIGKVNSDPELIRQMLINVVFNAIEASPAATTVTLRASRDERRGELVLEVCDFGPGLPKGDPEQLFQPFHTGKTKGTGLGLTVSRQIAESLGGAIHLENRREGGARCTVRVPAGRS